MMATLKNKVLTDAAEGIMQEKIKQFNPRPLMYISTNITVSKVRLLSLGLSHSYVHKILALKLNHNKAAGRDNSQEE